MTSLIALSHAIINKRGFKSNINNENFPNELVKGEAMDVAPSSRFLKLVALGCGAYVARELCVMFFVKPWNREEHGYERPPPRGNYPDLRLHNNLMANHLTPELYESLR